MADTPAPPALADPWSMTSDQVGARLAQMQTDMHPPPSIDPQTPGEASARLQQLVADKDFGARYLAGGVAERKEMDRLHALADQGDKVQDAINNTAAPETFTIETIGPGELNSRDRASMVNALRDAGLGDDAILQAMHGAPVDRPVGRAELMAAKALKSALFGNKDWRDRLFAGGWREKNQTLLISTIESNAKEGL
jgi:hypothetical protein